MISVAIRNITGQSLLIPTTAVWDTGMLEKARQMNALPYNAESPVEWYRRIAAARRRIKWRLDGHCADHYDLWNRSGLDPSAAHDALSDSLLTHHLFQLLKGCVGACRAEANSVKEPLIIRTLVKQRPPKPLALGLDLATNCGAAFGFFDPRDPELAIDNLWLGQFDLSAGSYESGAIRFVRLRQMLHELNPSVIFYENVRATPPQIPGRIVTPAQVLARAAPALELIGAFRATVCAYAEEYDIPLLRAGDR